MALSLKGTDYGENRSNSGSSTITFGLTVPANTTLLLALIAAGINTTSDPSPNGVTWNGDSMTEELEAEYERTNRGHAANIFSLANPDIGSYNLVVTKPVTGLIDTLATLICISGEHASWKGASAILEGNDGTNAYANVTTTANNSFIVATSILYRSGPSNPPGVYTERANTTEVFATSSVVNFCPNMASGYRTNPTTPGAYEIGWTCDYSSTHAFAALEVKAAGVIPNLMQFLKAMV
jgi:hypothetical protein